MSGPGDKGPLFEPENWGSGGPGDGDEDSSGLTEEFDELGEDVAGEFDPPAEGEEQETEEKPAPPGDEEDQEFAEGEEAYEDDAEAQAGGGDSDSAAGTGVPFDYEDDVAEAEAREAEEPAEDDEYLEDREFAEGEEAYDEETGDDEAGDEEDPGDDEAEQPQAEAPPEEPTGVQPIPSISSQETVEADVLALGDEEEARERAGQETGEMEAAEAPAEEATAEAPAEEAPAGPVAVAVAEAEEEEERPTPRLWARFLAASLVIVVSMGAATAVSILLYLSDIAEGLGGLPHLERQLISVDPGEPQTILIIGSDKRASAGNKNHGLSDTTMLLRLDPDRDAIAVLSLPRDLQVNIPGRGVAKLNEAYTIGGAGLTTRVVKQLTGLDINHVVNVNFVGFAKAVNAIGCVYVDVDRHYFNTNVGVAPSEQFAEINIPAGYQRLCGYQALQYVRYRHTDNDLVRSARQQDFLREARQKVPPTKLLNDRRKLIKIFTDYTTSDISNVEDVLDIFKTFLYLREAPVRQIHFKGTLGKSYVTASQNEIKKAVRQFLGVQATSGPRAPTGPSGGGKKGGKPKPKPAPVPLIDASAAGRQFAQAADSHLRFPVYYPTKIAPGSTIDDESRPSYNIVSPDGSRKYEAYKMVITRPSPTVVTEYYGVEGTQWTDPPILDNPTQTKEIGKREYLQFFDGERLRLVGWKTDKGSYWVSNTLGETLSAPQMMAIAQSMRPFSPGQ